MMIPIVHRWGFKFQSNNLAEIRSWTLPNIA